MAIFCLFPGYPDHTKYLSGHPTFTGLCPDFHRTFTGLLRRLLRFDAENPVCATKNPAGELIIRFSITTVYVLRSAGIQLLAIVVSKQHSAVIVKWFAKKNVILATSVTSHWRCDIEGLSISCRLDQVLPLDYRPEANA